MNKSFNISGIVFTVIGFVFTLVGIITPIFIKISTDKFMETAVRVRAEITDIETHYTTDSDGDEQVYHNVFVHFTTEDRMEVDTELNRYHSGMHVGDSLEVYYDPNNPYRIKMENGLVDFLVPIIFGIVGLPFLLIGLYIVRKILNLKKKIKWLVGGGYSVWADVVRVETNKRVKYNGRNPSYILCKYIDGDKDYMFKSEEVLYDLIPYWKEKVRVWLDRGDYSNYYVDLDSLPK